VTPGQRITHLYQKLAAFRFACIRHHAVYHDVEQRKPTRLRLLILKILQKLRVIHD
jgi:hypothetical protein